MAFELTVETAPGWVNRQGLNPNGVRLVATQLTGGVSASVVAVQGKGVGLVAKQALRRLRVTDQWEAGVERIGSEAAALRLFAELTPGAVPALLAYDDEHHVIALELVPTTARNWQSEIAAGRVHPHAGCWAGTTLATWHAATAGREEVEGVFPSGRAFEELRLVPFHETVIARLPQLEHDIRPYVAELRTTKRCLVDGDYAPKNMLLEPEPSGRKWVLDLEVAHVGNPVFDLAFFLSFVILSAVRWPALAQNLRELADSFLSSYAARAGETFAGDGVSITGHTACLVLARTDGTSPAAFLDAESRARARAAGIAMLSKPEAGLWSWN